MPSDSYYSVNFPGLEGITQTLVAQYNTMDSTWQDLKAQVPTTLADWLGAAKEEWAAVNAQMESLLGEVGAVLNMAGGHTANAHGDWLGTETANLRSWIGL